MRQLVESLQELEERLRQGGGAKKIEKQHRDGKLTARERIAQLVDPGAMFLEIGLLIAHDQYDGQAPAAGVVTGIGKIEGRPAVIVANDATVKAGAWWPETITKILRAQEIAMRNRTPIVYLVDSAGVNLPYQDGIFPDRSAPLTPSDSDANPRGSYVDLMFDRYVPDLTAQQLKDLLRPVFDFDSKSPLEAYLDTVPLKVKEAIKNHQVLVGMNRDMVIYAKGRPPGKEREKDGDVEYEEWIYGQPPQDVEFVRFVGDEVVRVETMKVGGEKIVRTEKEVSLEPQPSTAKSEEPRPPNAPSLRRPGEPVDTSVPTKVPSATPQPPLSSPPSQAPPSVPTPDPGTGQIPH